MLEVVLCELLLVLLLVLMLLLLILTSLILLMLFLRGQHYIVIGVENGRSVIELPAFPFRGLHLVSMRMLSSVLNLTQVYSKCLLWSSDQCTLSFLTVHIQHSQRSTSVTYMSS